jgi:hypothetical protein
LSTVVHGSVSAANLGMIEVICHEAPTQLHAAMLTLCCQCMGSVSEASQYIFTKLTSDLQQELSRLLSLGGRLPSSQGWSM